MFSRRASFDRSPNAFSRLVHEVGQASPLCDLTVSNPTQAGFVYPEQALSSALGSGRVAHYSAASLGSAEARRAVSELWAARGVQVPAERIALTASTSEAYAQLFKLFCDPGDRVLVPRPSYPLLAELAKYEAVQLVEYSLGYDGTWFVDVDAVARAMSERERVKAIVVVSPNNPTGNRLSVDELSRLLEFGVPVICDEVFGAYPLTDEPGKCWAVEAPARGLLVSLDGLSKYALLPQLKLAWLSFAGDAELVRAAIERLEFLLDASLSVSGPVQDALAALLQASEVTRRDVQQRLRHNLDLVDAACAGSALTGLHVEAGWYVVLRLPNLLSEEEWVSRLLLERHVLVQPGWFYDFELQPLCVVSLLTPSDQLTRGMAELVQFVSEVCEQG